MEIQVMISQEQVLEKVKEMAQLLNERYHGEPVYLVGILKGSVFFMCDLAKYLTMPVTMDFMKVSSYGDGTESSGNISIDMDLTASIEEKNVLVVEDIIDTGRTLEKLMKILGERNPKTLTMCTLLDKPSRRTQDIQADYTGFEIDDLFVVGYGLDYAQQYRNLPYIGVIQQ